MSRDENLTIGVVAHHAFCPRRAWLEVHGEKTDTGQMAEGEHAHRRADDVTASRSRMLHAVDVGSQEHGLSGRCDVLEVSDDGVVTVVEHKATPARRRAEVTGPHAVQLALQAICLEEAGRSVDGAAVWFSTHRKRVDVELDPELRERAVAEVRAARETLGVEVPPPALEDDPRCSRCSHVSVCLPDEHRRRPRARRIGVGDPAGRTLHLTTPGSIARLRRGAVEIHRPTGDVARVPLGHVNGVVVHGNSDLSSALIRELLWRGFSIVWCSWGGRVIGWASSTDTPNRDVRRPQHQLSESRALAVAREMVRGKILNQRQVLRRHQLDGRDELKDLAALAKSVLGLGELFGVEGRAAHRYFGEFGKALKPSWPSFSGRTRRPARDPINAALDLAYALLLADVLRAVVACGLDPAGGVLHSAGRNKPSLVLDLMEEFRPLIADSTVLWAVNNGELRQSQISNTMGAYRLGEQGRKALIAAYERRVDSEFRHPLYGYRVTWRRAMEIQARMFLAFVIGDVPEYRPIVMR